MMTKADIERETRVKLAPHSSNWQFDIPVIVDALWNLFDWQTKNRSWRDLHHSTFWSVVMKVGRENPGAVQPLV